MLVTSYVVLNLFVIFFFSSRRRHTRCSRDWSSDVCSSDLARDQLDFIRELHQIIIGAERKSLALDLRILVGREDNDRNVLGNRVCAELADEQIGRASCRERV